MRHSFSKTADQADEQRGFTIVELLIVIVIIGILAGITILAYNGIQQKAHVAALQSDLSSAASTLEIANAQNNAYPADLASAGLKASPGTTYQYTHSGTWNSYCLTGTNSGASYDISSMNMTPIRGVCFGDTNSNGPSTLTCPSGFLVVPGSGTYGTSDFCVMKYEAKQVGSTNVPISQAAGTPWVNISQADAMTNSPNVAGCSGCHLITSAEWLTIAQNVLSVASNWSGGVVGSGYIYSGHNDGTQTGGLAADTNDANGYYGETNIGGNQRRTLMLTNGAVIWDLAGNVWEMTQEIIPGNQQPGLSSDSLSGPKEWNNGALVLGALSATSIPSYGTPAASGWTSALGIGLLYSNRNSTVSATLVLLRGGSWGSSANTGVFYLGIGGAANSSAADTGFRVSR